MPKFFYGDGHSSDEPEPYNVQAIVQHTQYDGWKITMGGDYYVCVDGEWVECDLQGALDWMMAKGYLLQGRTLPNKEFADVARKAIEWRDSR